MLKRPDFIIVGSMKAGSTSLHDFLNFHPNVYLKKGEVHFFNNELAYQSGIETYYDMLGSKKALLNHDIIVGDDTPAYSYLNKIPKRIYLTTPHVKILWMLRNPISRAYSQYWHCIRHGIETNTFEEAVDIELSGKQEDKWKKYLSRSSYLSQINEYLTYFPREKILFVDFSLFIKGDKGEIDRIFKFLDIPYSEIDIPHSNTTECYPSLAVVSKYKDIIEKYRRRSLIEKESIAEGMIDKPSIDPVLNERLKKYFEQQMLEVNKITDVSSILV